MRVDWKRIILELVLQTLVELAPASINTLATVAEFVVQLTHTQGTASMQKVVLGTEQQYEGDFWRLTSCRFSAPSLT